MKKSFTSYFRLIHMPAHVGLAVLWVAGVVLVFVGTAVVTVCATLLFVGVFNNDVEPTAVTGGVETLSRNDLSKAVVSIDARKRDFERLKATPPDLADPSL